MFALSKYEQAKLFRLNQIRWGHYFNQWRIKVFRVCHPKCLKFESFCPSLWCFRRNGTRFCCRRQFLDGVKRACRGSDYVSILLQIVRKKGSFCLIVLLRGPLIIVYKRSRWPKKLPPSTTSSRSSISKSNPSWKATSVSQLPTKIGAQFILTSRATTAANKP